MNKLNLLARYSNNHRFMNKFFTLFFLLFFVGFSFGQTRETDEIRKINSYVKELSAYIDKNAKKQEVYADVSENDKPKWQKFSSEKAFEKYRENVEIYTIAYVWRKESKVVTANFTFTSGSGDWVHYVFYSFREDGTLAKIKAQLNTFYGNMKVIRNLYFNKNGKLIKKTFQYRDLQTGKLKKPGDDFYDNEIKIYRNTKRLPFINLVK